MDVCEFGQVTCCVGMNETMIDVTSLSIWKVIQHFLNEFNLLLTGCDVRIRGSLVSVKRKLSVSHLKDCLLLSWRY